MNFSILKKSFAFTLIEILISVSLIMIITGALIPSFSGYLKNQNLKQSQEKLVSEIRSIQVNALAGAETNLPSLDVAYWAVQFIPNSENYHIFISETTSCPNIDPAYIMETRFLPSGVQIKSYTMSNPSNRGCLFISVEDGSITPVNFRDNNIYVGNEGDTASADFYRVFYNDSGLVYTILQ